MELKNTKFQNKYSESECVYVIINVLKIDIKTTLDLSFLENKFENFYDQCLKYLNKQDKNILFNIDEEKKTILITLPKFKENYISICIISQTFLFIAYDNNVPINGFINTGLYEAIEDSTKHSNKIEYFGIVCDIKMNELMSEHFIKSDLFFYGKTPGLDKETDFYNISLKEYSKHRNKNNLNTYLIDGKFEKLGYKKKFIDNTYAMYKAMTGELSQYKEMYPNGSRFLYFFTRNNYFVLKIIIKIIISLILLIISFYLIISIILIFFLIKGKGKL